MVATVTYSLATVQDQFQANTWNIGTQLAPDVLGLSDGGYAVAYNNGDASNGYIIVDFYDAAGNSLGATFPFTIDGSEAETSTDAVGAPSLTELDNGNVLVVWADTNATSPGIRGTIFTSTGDLVRPEFAVAETPGSEELPQVTALEGGGFVVCHQGGGPIVLAKVFDDAGNVTKQVIVPTTAFASEPVITALADGGFVAVWTSGDTAGETVIRARIFEADGTPRSLGGSISDFVIGGFVDNSQPAVAALPNGNWAVAYTTDYGSVDRIKLAILGPDGSIVADDVYVNAPSGPSSDPDITVLDNGFIVISWTYGYTPSAGYDVYFRVFDQNGDPVTIDGSSEQRLLDASSSPSVYETLSSLSALLAGEFVAAWQDGQSDGSGGRISASVQELVRTTTGDNTSETLTGDALRDVINAGGGDDTLKGGGGRDTLNGGGDVDTADYTDKTSAVNVALNGGTYATVTVGGVAEDTVKNIENVYGGSAGDTLTGDSLANVLAAGNGNDLLKGGLGADTLNGGGDVDTADYTDKTSAVNVALNGGTYATVTVGGVAEDTVKNIENVNGGSNNDRLTGDANANVLAGGNGNDVLKGGAGADTLNGGGDIDTADYRDKTSAVKVTLNGGNFVTVTVGGIAEDSIKNIERVLGGTAADTLVGDSLANLFAGGLGNDKLTGAGASDIFLFHTTPNAATNLDHLTDFTTLDEIDLDNAAFTALTTSGTLASTAFYSAAGATTAHDASDRIVYNTTNGALYYDADGNQAGGVAAVQFAVVDTHAALTNADFVVV